MSCLPYQELLSIRDRIDDILGLGSEDVVTPRADLVDAGDTYQLTIEVPGVKQQDLEIALEGRDLTVAGIREPFVGGWQSRDRWASARSGGRGVEQRRPGQ